MTGFRSAALSAVACVAVSCASGDRSPHHPAGDTDTTAGDVDPGADARVVGDTDGPPISFVAVDGNYGDINVTVRLLPPDGGARDLVLYFNGGCTPGDWQVCVLSGDTISLSVGEHVLVWHSWDQQAGCSGNVQLRAQTDRGEQVDSDSFMLDNTGANSGFVELPQLDQGVNDDELDIYAQARDLLISDLAVDFVATRIGHTYEVHAARGSVIYERQRSHEGVTYEIISTTGTNPIANQDPTVMSTLAEELAAGSNPTGATLTDLGYAEDDPRLSYVEPEDDSYPWAYERIAAYFDHPDSADMMINIKGYAHGGKGTHRSLNIQQSRAPLLFWGRGIQPGGISEPSRQVNVAPTIAKLMGMPYTFGIDERGIKSHRVYLGWQDGKVLEPVLNGDIAQYVFVIVADGLTHTELMAQIETTPDDIPTLVRLKEEGAYLRYGSISNWPSVTYPGHNVVGAGAWASHLGLVDNIYYLRDAGEVGNPHGELFGTEHYWNPLFWEAESLHMAVHRVFGVWEPGSDTGGYTLSLFNPSIKDADTSDLETRDRSGTIQFPYRGLPPLGVPIPNVPTSEGIIFGQQMAEMLAMAELEVMFTNEVSPLPSYTIICFSTPDGAGEKYGPHSDIMTNVVVHIDRNIRILVQWLEQWGILEDSVIVLTADHGIQIGDPNRGGDPFVPLADLGIAPLSEAALGVYFDYQP